MHAQFETLSNDKDHLFVHDAQINGPVFIHFAESAVLRTTS